jgi:integrase
MPPKGSKGTTRRKPLRADRGVKLYGPTEPKPFFRVVAAGQVERTSVSVPVDAIAQAAKLDFDPVRTDRAVARARAEADELFDQMVAWAKTQVLAPKRGERTINALCDRRLLELRSKGRARGTIAKAEDLMKLYVRPQIGHVEVFEWSTEHSRTVLNAAKETCGAERIRDLGALLRSLVTLAHTKPVWLPKGDDPMEGVDYQVKATTQGEGVRYVPPSQRPSTEQVDSLAEQMAARGDAVAAYFAGRPAKPVEIDRSWGWLFPQVMGKCGPRAGEAYALTVTSCAQPRAEVEAAIVDDLTLDAIERTKRLGRIIDLPHGFAIDPGRRVITITEAVEWEKGQPRIVPPEQGASGKDPKSKKERWTIYPTSMLGAIVERCAELLERFGPDQGPAALLFPEHDHCFVEVPFDPTKPNSKLRWQDQDWWSPSEMRRSMYLKAVREAEYWPDEPPFPMENLRHHFATWAKRNDYPDELISHCMGHSSVAYTQQRYFRTGADTIPQGMAASEHL